MDLLLSDGRDYSNLIELRFLHQFSRERWKVTIHHTVRTHKKKKFHWTQKEGYRGKSKLKLLSADPTLSIDF